MQAHLFPLTVLLSLPVLPLVTAHHDNEDKGSWPQWRGPDRDGLSKETGWSAEGKQQNLWETNVGLGYSSVSIADGRLFTMGYDEGEGLDIIWCLDAETGEEIWAYPYPAKIWNQAHRGGTLNTPSIDGDVVYTLNREGSMYCFDAATGEVEWNHQLKEEYPELELPTWGYSASPLVLADELIVNCGMVMSLDKETGEAIWASKDYGHAYSTPAAFERDGQPLLAVLNGNGLAILEREGGQELYFQEWTGTRGINAASPIVIDDAVFISSSRKGACALLAMGESEMIPVWENRAMTSQMSGCVLMDDHLYGFDLQVLKCIGIDGEDKWVERGIGNGAISGAPGRLIAMSAEGELIVAEATSEKYTELSRVKLFDEGVFWTVPVLVDGVIYCRGNEGGLIARDHRAKK